jgi:hypothetical protein
MCRGIGLCISSLLEGFSGTRALRDAGFLGHGLSELRVTPFSGRITWLGFCGEEFSDAEDYFLVDICSKVGMLQTWLCEIR